MRLLILLTFPFILLGCSSEEGPTTTETVDEFQLKGSISGSIEDEWGNPLKNVQVTLIAENSQISGFTSNSDELGEFYIPNVSAGKYDVMLSKSNYLSKSIPSVKILEDQDLSLGNKVQTLYLDLNSANLNLSEDRDIIIDSARFEDEEFVIDNFNLTTKSRLVIKKIDGLTIKNSIFSFLFGDDHVNGQFNINHSQVTFNNTLVRDYDPNLQEHGLVDYQLLYVKINNSNIDGLGLTLIANELHLIDSKFNGSWIEFYEEFDEIPSIECTRGDYQFDLIEILNQEFKISTTILRAQNSQISSVYIDQNSKPQYFDDNSLTRFELKNTEIHKSIMDLSMSILLKDSVETLYNWSDPLFEDVTYFGSVWHLPVYYYDESTGLFTHQRYDNTIPNGASPGEGSNSIIDTNSLSGSC